ncbi:MULTISPECIES: PfkB family carbohydrate kinase [unclassified Rhizobium]|uniref:PfkB family carbohydrate kinase n=1 Tax=unclassified Rhizobium TaxID=2613769 RepID=UPI000BA8AEB1|nr:MULTISPECIES: PfkB family carbohydrate kinase [unclassified Rhizobium]ASW10765.1 ribokinase [Rhizobium sp. 11515TR]MDK4715262.1 PfkB family carbohydrate kinase [Rhizobium sp. CNPSo 4039]
MRLHVVGNVCVDTSFRLPRLPRPGETLNATSTVDGVGGKGANQAVAAARSGAAVCFWSALGNDDMADGVSETLKSDLEVDRMIRLPLSTDRSTILLEEGGENAIVSAVACARAFDPIRQSALTRTWSKGDILLMQGNLSREITASCLELAGRSGLRTVLNASPLSDVTVEDIANVDLVIVNQGEAAALTGMESPTAAANVLFGNGARSVVVTLGSQGSLIWDRADHAPVILAAPKSAVVDTSGAGDCFAGVLVGLLAQGKTLTAAAKVATKAAGISVGRPGTLASYPSRVEISDIIKRSELENT